ncbi:MAG TPA: DUF1801 domain-containing protein [Cytophagales bacterium]|nr:DUF1801 domain-containing protein [Cytophagales bacterium]
MKKNNNISVDDFMENLNHPFKSEIETVRKIILSANDQITEQIKWNGPSFCINGDDRVTFRLNPPKNIQLVFHRGAKVRTDTKDFLFDDPTGLLKWLAKDRGVVTFQDMSEITSRNNDLKLLVDKWVKATAY